jgi:putative tricarboxylic transport membrane protein
LALGLSVGVLVGYAYTLKPLGFLIPTAVAASILSYQIRPRALNAVATGVGLSLGLYTVFRFLLGLGLAALPKGWIA